jgi:hypothetical protein
MKERSGVCAGVWDGETTAALQGDTTDATPEATPEAPRAAPGAAALVFASMSLNAVGVACLASL